MLYYTPRNPAFVDDLLSPERAAVSMTAAPPPQKKKKKKKKKEKKKNTTHPETIKILASHTYFKRHNVIMIFYII